MGGGAVLVEVAGPVLVAVAAPMALAVVAVVALPLLLRWRWQSWQWVLLGGWWVDEAGDERWWEPGMR